MRISFAYDDFESLLVDTTLVMDARRMSLAYFIIGKTTGRYDGRCDATHEFGSGEEDLH